MAAAQSAHPIRDAIIGIVVIIVVISAIAGACSGGSSGGASSGKASASTDNDSGPNFKRVRCSEWLTYDRTDQVLYAQEFVRLLHGYDRSLSFAVTFSNGITMDCKAGPYLKVAEVVAALATIDNTDFPR